MKSISVTQARNNLAEILNQVAYQAERFVIQRRGKPVAVLVSPKKLKRYREDGQGKGRNPSETAGVFSLADADIEIDELFSELKSPYEEESLLGR